MAALHRPNTIAGHYAVRRHVGESSSPIPSPLLASRRGLSPTPARAKAGEDDVWRSATPGTRFRSLAMQYHALLCEQLGSPLSPTDRPDADRAATLFHLFHDFCNSVEPLKNVLLFFEAEFKRYVYADTGFAFNAGSTTTYSDEPFFAVATRLENEKVDIMAENTELQVKLKRLASEFQRRIATLEQETLSLRERSNEIANELAVVRQERDSLNADQKRFEREARNNNQELLNLQHRNAQLLDRNSAMKVDRDKLGSEVGSLRENILNLTNQLRNSIASLGEKEAECLNHVSISEVERLKQQIPDLEANIARQRKAIAQLANKLKQRDSRLEEVTLSFDQTAAKVSDQERQMISMTPRPDWFEVSTYVPTLVLENASSQQLLDDTCAEIQKLRQELESLRVDGVAPSYGAPVQRGEDKPRELKDFVGRGTGQHIPKYLRANGRIRHRYIKKRECERLIKEVWDLKAELEGNPLKRLSTMSQPNIDEIEEQQTSPKQSALFLMRQGTMGPKRANTIISGLERRLRASTPDRQRPESAKKKSKKKKKKISEEEEDAKLAAAQRQAMAQSLLDEVADVDRVNLSEFLYQYLQRKFETHALVVEYGYGLMAALNRYAYDADCELFLKILNGDVSEDAYYDQMIMLEQLFEAMRRLDVAMNGEQRGTILKKDFTKMLRDFFSVKSDDNFRRLIRALNLDCPGNVIEYAPLFEEDREGNQREFIECVRDQHLQEVIEYTAELETALRERADRTCLMSLRDARNAMLEADPQKPAEVVMHHVSQGAGQHPRDIVEDLDRAISADFFIKNLKKGYLRRYTKKDES